MFFCMIWYFRMRKGNCKLKTRAFVLRTVNRTLKIRQHMCPSTYEPSTHRIGPWNIMYPLPFTIIDSFSWKDCEFYFYKYLFVPFTLIWLFPVSHMQTHLFPANKRSIIIQSSRLTKKKLFNHLQLTKMTMGTCKNASFYQQYVVWT